MLYNCLLSSISSQENYKWVKKLFGISKVGRQGQILKIFSPDVSGWFLSGEDGPSSHPSNQSSTRRNPKPKPKPKLKPIYHQRSDVLKSVSGRLKREGAIVKKSTREEESIQVALGNKSYFSRLVRCEKLKSQEKIN
jgi:hypothetical protein